MEGGGKSLSLPRWRVVCAENVEPNREAERGRERQREREREAIYDVRVFYNARNIMHTNVLRTNIVFEWRTRNHLRHQLAKHSSLHLATKYRPLFEFENLIKTLRVYSENRTRHTRSLIIKL